VVDIDSVAAAPASAAAGLTPERLAWLVRLRWVALGGIVVAVVVSAAGAFPGVNYQVMAATALGAAAYNFLIHRDLRAGRAALDRRTPMYQALIDFLSLSMVLWAAGGLSSPFVIFYIFHVALAGILAGPRATLVAAGLAFLCAGLLWLTGVVAGLRIGTWDPVGLWEPASRVVAFVFTVGAVAYLVLHAVAELRDRERALQQARDRAELEYELLSNTLDELDAGLEVLDADHRVVWRNRLANRLVPRLSSGEPWNCPGMDAPCERDASGLCPIDRSFALGEAGRCRFATQDEQPERVYELLAFPLSSEQDGKARVMNLYLDRTSATLAERQLVLAERLASLGRVAQGVAHELNTPLATIRTLAADMGVALARLDKAPPDTTAELLTDLGESTALIRSETERLGRITHSLLAGGDLLRLRIVGEVSISAVVERARALVFAGDPGGVRFEVESDLDRIQLRCDQDRLVQVLVNLIQNAYDALREGGGSVVRVSAVVDDEDQADGAVRILIEDDGPGLDPVLEGRLFEPFTTTKAPGRGTGLGLYTSYMLVRAMHGSLELGTRDSGGTRAELRLPLASAGSAALELVPKQGLSA